MPFALNAGTRIYFHDVGGSGIPVLLIHGFTVQLLGWRPGFVQELVDRGLRPVLFDNRDAGLSDKTGGPDDIDGHYGLDDMADDGFAVLDALEIDEAHLLGQSMGGMIAQAMAIRSPGRVKSLTLFYSAPNGGYGIRNEGAKDLSVRQDRLARDEAIKAAVEREHLSASPEFAFDEDWHIDLATRSYDRCYAPDGYPRQARAMSEAPDRSAALAELQIPTVLIHGRHDRHLSPQAALDMAAVIPQSELHLYEGLGHEIARPLWADFGDIILRNVLRAEKSAADKTH
jgi:pimeloyl-ACP methyl ester carboxylesterase